MSTGLTPKQARTLRDNADYIAGRTAGLHRLIAEAVNTHGASPQKVAELVDLTSTQVARIAKKHLTEQG